LFTNEQGNMRLELTTDGLHLSSQGYLVWSSALQLYSQMKL
ncbi:MAG: G-D-S-L family lipolytic protein, partial [Calothrix sp. MO_167.B12]|nr:G-D-S-L family lipolytic protein [Calothrix sp. MO_167.B12]